MTEDSYTF